MARISNVLRSLEGGRLAFRCPGCKTTHSVNVGDGPGPRWAWNGDVDKPTFTPSVLVQSGHYVPGSDPRGCWCTYNAQHYKDEDPDFKCFVCHSFVTDGRIQFLGDCTHALAGQTVDLAEFAREE